MNGVLRKISEARQRQWDEATRDKQLCVDLLVPEEQLFTEALDQLRVLDLGMLDEMKEPWSLRGHGTAFELAWHNQRNLIAELIAFQQRHKDFNPLADGPRVFEWVRANGGVFTRSALDSAFITIKSLDDIRPAEPPIITQQPVERMLVVEGEPAVFSVEVTGTAPLNFQWYQGDRILLDATKATYRFINTDWFMDREKLHVVIRNSAGEVRSNDAVLRVVKA